MKYIIYILFMLPVFCFGQESWTNDGINFYNYKPSGDSIWNTGVTKVLITGDFKNASTDTSSNNNYHQLLRALPRIYSSTQLDTIPVIMLVCDTVATRPISKGQEELQYTLGTTRYQIYPTVYWQKGYSVREKHNTCEGSFDPGINPAGYCRDYWQHMYYLNEDRKPLPKNIIVWQSK